MKVYRNNIFIINNVSELPVKQIGNTWYNPSGHKVALHPQINTVIHTGADFEGYTNIRIGFNIQANSYYRFDGTKKARSRADQNLYAKWTNISAEQASALGRIAIFNIMEGTYTGKDMGERSIVATIDFPSRIDFQIGDYVEFEIANLERTTSIHGGSGMEKFYIYTMPTVKKVASRLSFGKAFQHTVTFYPCQYELATVKMRDVLQDISSGVIYTGYDEFSFYGGANTLMKRIMAVLDERFGHTGVAGKDYWSYQIADSINEDRNTALEKFQFDFSDSNVMEALLKLNDAEGINTKFFINERMIYVGFKRPYIVGVDEHNQKRDIPFEFAYGKTSHLPIETNHGNLYTITKSNGSASPITRLYAYGAERNLQRFYCSDRIKTGRYVNKLMLPSFEDDGRTDYIDSPEGIARFGIREGTKTFDNIYPSLRFFYYGNLRDVKYCIKLMGSGLQSDSNDPEHVPADTYGIYDGGTTITKANVTPEQIQRAKEEVDRTKGTSLENETRVTITIDGVNYSLSVTEADQLINKGSIRIGGVKSGRYHYPIARIQCYRVEELLDGQGNHTGLNYLVESAPPVDLAVFCHATGKVVKCVLYAAKDGQSSTARQLAADGKIPTRTEGGTDYIVGSCFAVHDGHPTESNKHFECGHLHPSLAYPGLPNSDQRAAWFTDADSISTSKDGSFYKPYDEYKNQVSIHQIHYTDDHWITDVYEFTDYHQDTFNRQGYSAYCWPRVNKYYPNSQADNIEVNAVLDVGPVLIEDTDLNTSQGHQQQTFDIYMRDMGFKINDQTWFGDKCFLFDTCKISFLDGNLGGYEFEMPAESDQDKLGSIYVPALAPDGTRNPEFFDLADNPAQAEQAYLNGAFWRIVAKRAETEVDRYWVPNVNLNASAGDHVVFLDIFMPDLYIRVAEQRLYKEAKKYLDANDDGDIQYSFDFDKVRMLKQPTFPLQMREGAIMRVIDDDLDVGTVNAQKTLFEDKNGLVTTTSLVDTSAVTETHDVLVFRNLPYLIEHSVSMCQAGEEDGRYYIELHTSSEDANATIDISEGITVQFADNGNEDYTIYPDEIVQVGAGVFKCYYDLGHLAVEYYIEMYGNSFWAEYNIVTQDVEIVSHVGVYPAGKRIYAIANTLTEFQQGKYYEVEIDLMEPNMAIRDNNMMPIFALANGIGDGQRVYNPDYTVEDITPDEAIIGGVYQYERLLYKFTLPDGFNGNVDYYPAFLCASDGVTESVHVRLWSIVERDDAAMEDLNYVDLAIDTVTIKFHDNTREKDVSLQDGQEPERLRDNLSEMSREVSATVKEESRATAWAQLMDRVTEAEQLQDQTLDFYQSLVDASRKHYLELLNLKNNIFDPDGTCKETFLQIMMLQVGADSMNYQLKYTHYSMNGHTANCGLRFDTDHPTTEITDPKSGKAYIDSFFIGNSEEVLDHYVYTENPNNGEGGRWYPQERNTLWPLHKVVGPDGTTDIYPVYFVALKASRKLPNDCHWVCDTVQHMVNEDDNYFYFNWGILAPESETVGKYALTETRGNAYMYGDNLICGQISTLAGNSYFDLTHGNFVLSKDGPDSQGHYHEGLTYINGVLTIYGFAKDSDIQNVLTQLGLVDDKADAAALAAQTAATAASAAQQAANAAQQAVDNVTNDGIISKGTEKQELNREFIIIAGSNRDGEGTDGSYYKNTAQADEYGLDHSALDDAFEDLYAAMKVVLGTSQSTGKIDGSKIQQDTYIGGLKNGTATYDIRQPYGDNMYVGDNPLVLYDGKYYTGIIPEYDKAYMLSIKRVDGDAYALAVIKKTGESTSEDIAMLISRQSGDPTVYTNIKQNITHVSEELGFRCGTNGGGQSFELTGVNIRPWTNIGIDEFNALWKNYYDAEVELLNRISNAIDEREIGGENLSILDGGKYEFEYTYESVGIMSGYIDLLQTGTTESGGTIFTYLPAGKYVFSAKEIYGMILGGNGIPVGSVTYTLEARKENDSSYSPHRSIQIDHGDNVVVRLETEYTCTFRIKYAYGISQNQTVSMRLVDVMLQRGTKPTSYQDYVKHLTDALHGTTDIAGGLTMTNLLMLKNEKGKVKAGMSGLTGDANNPENVAMWAGGSYQDALDQLAGIINTLPLLLTKLGIGSKIGCFNVDTANQVSIIGADGTSKFIFNTGDATTGAYMSIEKDGGEVILVTTDEIHPEKETVEFGRFDFGSSYKILFHNGEDTTGKVIQLETFKLIPASCKLSKTNVVHMRFRGIMNSSSMTLSFSIYVGGKYLMGISNQSISYVDVSGGWYVFDKLFAVSLPNTLNLSSLASEDVVIDMRNISYSGGVSSVSMQLLAFGEGELTGGKWTAEDGKWNDYNLRLYHANIAARTTIGRNGLSTMGADGVSVNFLREEGTLVFRVIGLPQKNTSTKQVISQNYSLQQFRTLLRDLIAGWNSHTQETRVAYANQMYDALPSLIKSLSMQ